MNIKITDTCVVLEEGAQAYPLLEKPNNPDFFNVTARPYISAYHVDATTIWDKFCFCMENLPFFCPGDPYLGCYALTLRRLYPLLLSSSQAKNVIAYGPPTDCGAYRVFQDFMTFLQEGNALTALAHSPFAFTSLLPHSCHALIYRLDTCPALRAVCDAADKVRSGGLITLYTMKEEIPAELTSLCSYAEKDSFGSCTVYTLTMDEALAAFTQANGVEAFLLARADDITGRANDLRELLQAMLAGAVLPADAYLIAATVLQQTEELLLSIYDYLENDELPVLVNALKEAVINYYVGVSGQYDLATYREKLTQSSEMFFAVVEQEFQ